MNIFDSLTDAELADHLNAALVEQERRAAQANIPRQVASLAVAYQAGGGDVAELHKSITPAAELPEVPEEEIPAENPELPIEPPVEEPEADPEESEDIPVEDAPVEEPNLELETGIEDNP